MFKLLIEIDEQGFTADGKFRLVPLQADMNMYYAGATVEMEHPGGECSIAGSISPQKAIQVWDKMVQAFVAEPVDYNPYQADEQNTESKAKQHMP